MLRKSFMGLFAAGVGVFAGVSSQEASAQQRFSADKKGSVLIFSKVQITWDADTGALLQDTILGITNEESQGGVDVQAYFINGDPSLEEVTDPNTGEVLQEFEPGWNTADCRFHLTKDNPIYWSAARGGGNLAPGGNNCQPFDVLDVDGPGRLSPDRQTRTLRGMVIMWAVAFDSSVVKPDGACDDGSPQGAYRPIHWNNLAGSALYINYEKGMASEVGAWAGQAQDEICVPECGIPGTPPCLPCLSLDCKIACSTETFDTGDFLPFLGQLNFDGNEYDYVFAQLLFDFYGTGGTGFSIAGVNVTLDTELTLHPALFDVRQDGFGPPLTKADMEIFNEFESKFSGTRRCICCWDSTLIGSYARTVAVPNHFLRSRLGTDKGSARITGKGSSDCDYFEQCGREPNESLQFLCRYIWPYNCSFDFPLLGVATKLLVFSKAGAPDNRETAAMNLHGLGTWDPHHRAPAGIFHDVEYGSCGLRDAQRDAAGLDVTSGDKNVAGERTGRGSVGSGK